MTKTVFVTGASGFIGKHVVLQLLEAGYKVRGSVRSQAKADETRAAMKAHLGDATSDEKSLSFAVLDLTSDQGWGEALNGADILMHTASPFPMAEPKDEDDLIRPAVDGTLRALKAAQAEGIARVVLTSSVAAVYAQNPVLDGAVYDESHWTDPESPLAAAYVKSKTFAEQAAWDFVRDHNSVQLTTINPSLVLGPALDAHFGTSLAVVQRILKAKDPILPKFGMEIVDVRDIAKMHVAALLKPESIGHRFIGSNGFMWMYEVADFLKARYPDRKIITRRAPSWLIRLYALADPAVRLITPQLGKRITTRNARAKSVLGIDFIPATDAISASAHSLVAHDQAG